MEKRKKRSPRKKKVRQFNKVGIEIQTDRPERERSSKRAAEWMYE